MTRQPDVDRSPLTTDEYVVAVRAAVRLSRQLEHASAELNLAQYRVLSEIGAGAQRASRIAQRLALGKPTVSVSVDALCRRGLVQRTAAEGDQRAVTLSLTDDGARLLARVEGAMVAKLATLCDATGVGRTVFEALSALGTVMEAASLERSKAGQ